MPSIIDYADFKKIYIVLMRVICICSLILMIGCNMFGFLENIFPKISVYSSDGTSTYRIATLFFSNVYLDIPSWTSRNFGPFWEPGAYATYICVFQFIILFTMTKYRGKMFDLILSIITLVSTASLGGISSSIVLVIIYLIYSKRETDGWLIVSIQGIAKECFVHYLSGVDYKYIKKQCLTDILRGKSIYLDAINMETRGILEDQTFELAVNCIGRTDFDRRYVQLVNPSINYYSCNETLRNCFYDGSWNLDKCVKHSIIMSQGGYPLKGLHNVLKALPIIKKRYPDVVLYLAGGIVIQDEKSMSILKRMVANHAYSQFLNELVKKGGLENSIVQLGSLSAEKMKEAYLKANVYLLASSIENSPNSLGEAMLLGVPAVVSNVGGVRSMCDDNIEVLMYQHDDYYMLASRIIELFQDEELQLNLSKKSKIRAINSHDSDKNYCKLTEIYSKLCEKDISLKEQKKVMKGRT